MPFPSRTRFIGVAAGYLLVCLGVSAGHNRTTPAKTACHTLNTVLGPDKVQSAGGAQYEASATGAWDIYNQLDRPTCIVFPRNSSDVVSAMRTIFHSDEHYAVRGGGHSAMPGWNTIDNGVLIDFSQMKAFSYDPVRDSIFIEPGVLLEEVYDGLQSQGVAPVGGRLGHSRAVGFSGLALGGGLSFLSPSQGWACDRFRSLDVVLTNGRLVTATHTNEYSDLFTALKGGGSRFGIVTRYEVDAIHVGTAADKTYWGGSIDYVGPTSAAIVKAIDALVYSNKDPNAVIVATVAYSNISGTFTRTSFATLFYNGTEAQFKQVFADFLAIPAVATNLGPLSYNEVTKVLTSSQSAQNVYGGSALYPGQGLFEKSYNNWLNFSTSFKDEVSTAFWVITPVFQSQIDISRAHGGTSFTPPNGAFGYLVIGSILPLGVTKISKSLRAGLDRLYHEWVSTTASLLLLHAVGLPLYLNESEDVQDALTTYSGYEKLKEIYRKYDPTRFNVRRMVGGGNLPNEVDLNSIQGH
ncbi:hypothetical protein BS47DRAFT_1367192 [Hydnum rufescens UP504]|uniref:FAD-binding PCMH-type domain-containing protein n=1 Tax=Hydnum rufescens UP504 TaxID=1448309 RepID=A0A9P6DPU5_9AGAM|nr:hypothetical protein BS47DRAFT_1367192 [Hydnum rufescens UP504]